MKAPARRRQKHCSMVLLPGTTEAMGNSGRDKHVTEERGCCWHFLHDAEGVKDLEVDISSASA